MKHKKSRSRRYGAGSDAVKWLIVILLVAGLVYVGFGGYIPGLTQKPVNIGTDLPATVAADGSCTSREGTLIGMCCSVLDYTTMDVKYVDCEQLVNKNPQAMFKLDSGSQLYNIADIAFFIRLTNTGNYQASVRISNISTTIVSGGNAATVTEIDTAFDKLEMATFTNVPAGAFIDQKMVMGTLGSFIRLDRPVGFPLAFTAGTGTYAVKIESQMKEDNGVITQLPTRTLNMIVTQETVGFTMDVTTATG